MDDIVRRCYCYTCKKSLNYLGFASHRAMHRRKQERCRMEYSDGRAFVWDYRARDEEGDGAEGCEEGTESV